jgi:adenosylmethionine-8-amino-7-oxononanoate aminotransferase
MDCICLAPPLITDDADLDRIVDIVGESITEVLKAVPQAAVAP